MLIAKFGFSLGALSKGGSVLASEKKEPLGGENHLDIVLPGRLGSPTLTMFEDPRLDPRIIKELTTNTLPPASMPPEITLSSSYESAIEWIE
ncbi:hypothetical protein OAK26_06555, partial [Gammaproteobacteria bacterium]|nr:hypothetical protein [Gammaproteobacteria bacterium]